MAIRNLLASRIRIHNLGFKNPRIRKKHVRIHNTGANTDA